MRCASKWVLKNGALTGKRSAWYMLTVDHEAACIFSRLVAKEAFCKAVLCAHWLLVSQAVLDLAASDIVSGVRRWHDGLMVRHSRFKDYMRGGSNG